MFRISHHRPAYSRIACRELYYLALCTHCRPMKNLLIMYLLRIYNVFLIAIRVYMCGLIEGKTKKKQTNKNKNKIKSFSVRDVHVP